MTELTADAATSYLRGAGVIPAEAAASAAALGGGVSNRVTRVTWGEDCVVLKQPLPDLAVEDDWPADVTRVHNEAAAARAYRDVLAGVPIDGVRVPAVVHEDRDAHAAAFECGPDGADIWKADLLAGAVDPAVAGAVGRLLGAVHDATAADPPVDPDFGATAFEQLRVDPYYRALAQRHPEHADAIEARIDAVTGAGSVLVHGDYSPKNVLVDHGGERPELWVLDFEVAHWGAPAFDPAFLLNHLLIKSLYNADRRGEYVAAAERFWTAYTDAGGAADETAVVDQLGVLLLARVDGKSPVEYVDPDGPVAAAMRAVAVRVLDGEAGTLDELAALLDAEGPR